MGGPFTMEFAGNCQQNFLRFTKISKNGPLLLILKKTCGSAVLMDQALEKVYNNPVKGQGGIIGLTRRKEAVAQFNLIRHKKAKISSFLRSICHLTMQDEYTLRHEFLDSITRRNSETVKEAVDYIRNKHNPLRTEINDQMRNLVTEERITTETKQFSLQCNALGTDIYKENIVTQYINKSKKLFGRLSCVKILVDRKQEQEKKVDLHKETMKFCRKIDVARSRRHESWYHVKY